MYKLKILEIFEVGMIIKKGNLKIDELQLDYLSLMIEPYCKRNV